tara:strand:+ start:1297 stop:1557 length:261 start_codon:yes stop_codon:yes gene_type:complete
MAKASNRKKPTMKETVQVINQIIREITNLRTDVQTMTGVLDMYIEMNNDTDKFKEFLDKRLTVEEDNDVRKNEEGSTVSVEGSPQD